MVRPEGFTPPNPHSGKCYSQAGKQSSLVVPLLHAKGLLTTSHQTIQRLIFKSNLKIPLKLESFGQRCTLLELISLTRAAQIFQLS